MKLTTKGRYAVTAMFDLAIHHGRGPIALTDIARRQGISLSYLEQLFSRLRKRSLVSSVRGPGGGYNLTRNAAEIPIAEVISAVDENVDTTRCGGAHNCRDEGPCLTHDLWQDLGAQIYDYLNRISLQDLVDRKGAQEVAERQDLRGPEVTIDRHGAGGLSRLAEIWPKSPKDVAGGGKRFGALLAMKLPIYMDYSATTPVDPRVAEKMCGYLTPEGGFGNPASRSHSFGWEAEDSVDEARRQVAGLINADPREIVWTSGATESNNLAIKGVARFYHKQGRHIITSKTEHKAVLDTCRRLERDGFEVTYLDPQPNGLIALTRLEAALRDDTILVSIMHVNNEIGVIQDIAGIGELTRARKILFHVDAAQSAGKIPIDLERMKIDLMSFSAHKVYGPKGIGALYVRRKPRVRLEAQMHGGGHERGMRSGTLATHQIVGMGEAFRIAREEMATENERILALRHRLWDGLKDMEQVVLNGDGEQRVAGNLNLSFAFVEGESLIMALKDLAVSSGSACTSASLEPSYVLRALGREDELAHSSIRFSLGRFTTSEEVDFAVAKIREQVGRLRELSPLWDMFQDGVDLSTVQWTAH